MLDSFYFLSLQQVIKKVYELTKGTNKMFGQEMDNGYEFTNAVSVISPWLNLTKNAEKDHHLPP